MNKTEIVKANSPQIAPAYSRAIAQTAQHYQTMIAFVSAQMKKDIDYGVIPGTKKPTLLKPGAEKGISSCGVVKWWCQPILHPRPRRDGRCEMSILATSPEAIRILDMEVANALGSMEAAMILQQLHYWLEKKGVGIVIDGIKFIYNTFQDWVSQQFIFLTEWKFRQAMNILRSLSIVEVIRYKSKQWNQTNYYSLNYKRLREWAKAESIEISEMWSDTDRGDEYLSLEMENPSTSYKRTKNTSKKVTTKQKSDRLSCESKQIAAAQQKTVLEEEKSQKDSYPYSDQLKVIPGQNKANLEVSKSNPVKEKKVSGVDYIINSKLIPLLDGAGIPINKTLKDLLKFYPVEKVESAITLVKARKREHHIPNPSGYFVAALKGDWGSQNVVSTQSDCAPRTGEANRSLDKAAVFRHWYDLARELGYCSGQEVREGEQWVCLSGSWEKWQGAVNRGYSLDYLKKIMKRSQRQ